MLPPRKQHDGHVLFRARILVVTFTVLQFILHLYAVVDSQDPRLMPPHLVAWLQDLLLLSMLLVLLRTGLLLPSNMQRFGQPLFLGLLMFSGASLSIYPQMLREYLSFPVNLFSGGYDSGMILLTRYLGFSRLFPVIVALTAGFSSLWITRSSPVPERMSRLYMSAWALLAIGGLLTLPRSPHPVVNSLREEFAGLISNTPREVPGLLPARRRNVVADSSASRTLGISGPLNADYIYLIVLEGVTADEFEHRFLRKERSGFYRHIFGNARYFERYYTTNLDSYTSLIAMLTSEQVPYRSYTDTGLYEAVNRSPNLVSFFKKNGYHCCFISTYDEQPFVPVRQDWSRIMHRRDLPQGGHWVRVESGRMETATEDRAALTTIMALQKKFSRAFILHELAYGHSTAWRAKTGLSQLDYYDMYLNELLNGLMANPGWSKSLVVIVSDHGKRFEASSPGNYRIPLLFVGPSVVPGQDYELRSHLDLQRIITASLTNMSMMPQGRPDITVVGSTERWIYGSITSTGDYLFIDDHRGRITTSHGDVNPKDFQRRFQRLIDDFGSRFGP